MSTLSLRRRLTVVLTVLVMVPLILSAVVIGILVPRALHQRAEAALEASRGAVTSEIFQRCRDAALTARALGLEVANGTPAELATGQIRRLAGADYVAVLDERRAVTAWSGDLPVGSPAPTGEENCLDGQAQGQLLTAVQMVSLPAEGAGAVPKRIPVVGAFRLDDQALLLMRLRLHYLSEITLVREGRIVASTVPMAEAEQLVAATAGHERIVEVAGRVAMAAPAAGTRPYTVIASDEGPMTNALRLAAVAILLAAVVTAVVVARQLARGLTRPLDELDHAAARVAAGDFETTIPARGDDEAGRLAASFNNMTAALRLSMAALERSRDEMRANLLRLGEALTRTHDLDGICRITLDTALSISGADAGVVLLDSSTGVLDLVTAKGLDEHAQPEPRSLPTGEGVLGGVLVSGQPVRGALADMCPAPGEPSAGHVLAVPLPRRSGVGGVLALYSFGERGFDRAQLQTLRTLAGQAGVAVDNALLHAETQRLSLTDPITGTWNYRYLMMGLGREVERSMRFGRPFGIVMVDVDHFKEVNDSLGHEAGNAVLAEVAERIRGQVRDIDVVARYGGDEFTVVLPETSSEGSVIVAERILAAVRAAPVRRDGQPSVRVTVSAGVATFPAHGASAATLISAADAALYAAKGAGRDRTRLASTEPGAPAGPASGSGDLGGAVPQPATTTATPARQGGPDR